MKVCTGKAAVAPEAVHEVETLHPAVIEAAAIGIIGGADGPTSIYVASVLAPHLLGAIAVSAYAYMAMVPMIQPPIMKALTSEKERAIKMIEGQIVQHEKDKYLDYKNNFDKLKNNLDNLLS